MSFPYPGMRRWFMSALLVLAACNCLGQSVDTLFAHYTRGEFSYVMQQGLPLLKRDDKNATLLLVLGRAYADSGLFEAAIPYLEGAVAHNADQQAWQKAWGLAYLGTAQFMAGRTVAARRNLEACVVMNATKNSTRFAAYRLALMGLTKDYDSFVVRQSAHFRFHFHPAVPALTNVDSFIQVREAAYDAICRFLRGSCDRTIDFFVWPDAYTPKSLLGQQLGFSMPDYCIVQSYYRQTSGHEIAHVLAARILHVRRRSAIVNEGIAVYLDQSGRDYLALAREAYRKAAGDSVSVAKLWNGSSQDLHANDELVYPIGAALMEFLERQRGHALLLQLIRRQSLDDARRIYGDDFDRLLTQFERLLAGR